MTGKDINITSINIRFHTNQGLGNHRVEYLEYFLSSMSSYGRFLHFRTIIINPLVLLQDDSRIGQQHFPVFHDL